MFLHLRRRAVNAGMLLLCTVSAGGVVFVVGALLVYLVHEGLPALNWDFFTKMPKPVGEPGGGMANAIVGSLILVGGAAVFGLPVGLLGGIYLAEFGDNRFGWWVRFAADVLNGVPSIVMGVVVYALVVLRMGRFSALAGSLALAGMMIPLVMRTTEEMIRLAPGSLREASLALGASYARTEVSIVLPAALGGVVTGMLLALARIAGETAPLLFTAFGNRFWSIRLNEPMASLPVQLYTYAIAPYDDWHAQAWCAALVLVAGVLALNILARAATRGKTRSQTRSGRRGPVARAGVG